MSTAEKDTLIKNALILGATLWVLGIIMGIAIASKTSIAPNCQPTITGVK